MLHNYEPFDATDDMEIRKTQLCFALERVTGLCTVAESTNSHLHVNEMIKYCLDLQLEVA